MQDYASCLNTDVIDRKISQSLGSTQYPDSYTDDLFENDVEEKHSMYDILFDDKPLGEIVAEVASSLLAPPSTIDAKHLSKIWRIRHEEAKKVLEQSTYLQRTGQPNALSRRLPTNDRMLRYRRTNSDFFTDTFFATSKGKTLRGHTCSQLFVNDKGFFDIYHMKTKSEYNAKKSASQLI